MKRIIRENPIKVTIAFLCFVSVIGISFWSYYAPVSATNWNRGEISRIKVGSPDNFAFAVFGDNKGNSSFFGSLLRDIERDKDIAFAIDIGGLAADGKRSQFRRFLEQVRANLSIPFLTATGNHDFNKGFDNYEVFSARLIMLFRQARTFSLFWMQPMIWFRQDPTPVARR